MPRMITTTRTRGRQSGRRHAARAVRCARRRSTVPTRRRTRARARPSRVRGSGRRGTKGATCPPTRPHRRSATHFNGRGQLRMPRCGGHGRRNAHRIGRTGRHLGTASRARSASRRYSPPAWPLGPTARGSEAPSTAVATAPHTGGPVPATRIRAPPQAPASPPRGRRRSGTPSGRTRGTSRGRGHSQARAFSRPPSRREPTRATGAPAAGATGYGTFRATQPTGCAPATARGRGGAASGRYRCSAATTSATSATATQVGAVTTSPPSSQATRRGRASSQRGEAPACFSEQPTSTCSARVFSPSAARTTFLGAPGTDGGHFVAGTSRTNRAPNSARWGTVPTAHLGVSMPAVLAAVQRAATPAATAVCAAGPS